MNPLISLCNCIGSLQFTHLKCLKQWIAAKTVRKTQETVESYYFKLFECEICKSPYPCKHLLKCLDAVSVGERRHCLIDVQKPAKENFIQLETITRSKLYSRSIHIIRTTSSRPQVKIGRGRSADLIIDDISVSRVHALVKMTEEGFVLEDNGSKFGSLLLLPPGLHPVPADRGLFLQFSRSTLLFTVKEKKTSGGDISVHKIVEALPATHSEGDSSPSMNESDLQKSTPE